MKQVRKIFSKVTIFDYLVFALMIVILLVAFIFFYRKSEYITIKVKVASPSLFYPVFNWTDPYPSSWYAQNFKAGDIEKDTLGRVTAQILNVQSFDITATKKLVYLKMKVRAVYDSRTKSYTARGKKIVFGTMLRFDMSGVSFDGYVVDFPGSKLNKDVKIEKREIEVFSHGLMDNVNGFNPRIFESVKVGDTVKDSDGQVIATVKKVILGPAMRITTDDQGRVYMRQDPFYKDLNLTLDIQLKEINGELYIYDDLPIRIGMEIPITFNTLALNPIVLSINEK